MARKQPKKKPQESDPLEEMHNALTTALLSRIRTGVATAADLSVARQFLKDNGIEVGNLKGKAAAPIRELALTVPFAAPDEATGT